MQKFPDFLLFLISSNLLSVETLKKETITFKLSFYGFSERIFLTYKLSWGEKLVVKFVNSKR